MLEYEHLIKEQTERCPTTTFLSGDGKSSYTYVILPFDSRLSSDFSKAIRDGMTRMLSYELSIATAVLLPEAKAFLLHGIAERSGIDSVLLRKRNYNLPHQIRIEISKRAYREKGRKDTFYCLGLHEKDIILLLDDVVTSGGVITGIVKTLRDLGFSFAGIGTVYEKGNGIEEVKHATGIHAKALARLEVVNGRPVVAKFYKY